MNLNIHIPTPCHEDWQQMTLEAQGRHCAQCNKIVVDFTNWTNEDILRYLQKHSTQKTCGRFKTTQIYTQSAVDNEQFVRSVTWSPLPFIKKIAAVILFAFGLMQISCNAPTPTPQQQQHTSGVIMPIQDSLVIGKIICPSDTTHTNKHHKIKHKKITTLGEVAVIPDTPTTIVPPAQPEIMGDIAVIEPIVDTTGPKK